MTSYRAYTNNALYFFFLFAAIIIIGVAFFGKPITALYLGGPVMPMLILYKLLVIRISEIQLDKEAGTLTAVYRNYLWKKKETAAKIENLEFTYKRGDTLKQDDNNTVCTLFDGGKEMLKLRAGKDGWIGDQLFDLVQELKQLGVQKKFTGYMMKDAGV